MPEQRFDYSLGYNVSIRDLEGSKTQFCRMQFLPRIGEFLRSVENELTFDVNVKTWIVTNVIHNIVVLGNPVLRSEGNACETGDSHATVIVRPTEAPEACH